MKGGGDDDDGGDDGNCGGPGNMITKQMKSQHESDHRPVWETPTIDYAAIMQKDSAGQTRHRKARYMRNPDSQEIRHSDGSSPGEKATPFLWLRNG